jgi:Putative adhesin
MEKTFEVTGPIAADVQLASGDIRVDRGPEGVATVELVAHSPEAQELVDAARVELRGNELIVDVPQRRGGFNFKDLFGGRGIDCRVGCADGSSLRVRSKSADVVAAIDLAAADISTASGDARLQDVHGDLTFKGASGDLTARNVGGRASANTASGDIELGNVGASLNANSASGDIAVESVGGDARANTASGDIRLDAVVAGEVSVNSASGDVSIAVRRGSTAYLDCSTVSGDARSELDMTSDEPNAGGPLVTVKARTVSGDIVITRAAAPAGNTQEVQA